jgi:NADH dehydrogenase
VIFGAEDKFLNLFADLQAVAPFMPLAGSGTRFAPVWVGDVARAVVVCLQKPDTIGQTYELCGPDVLTLGELVKRAGQWAGVNHGRGRPVIGLPMWVGWLQAAAMEPGQPGVDESGQHGHGPTPRAFRLGHQRSICSGCGAQLFGPPRPTQPLERLACGCWALSSGLAWTVIS